MKNKRYSNVDTYVPLVYATNEDGSIYTGVGNDTSGSGAFNWVLFGQFLNNLTNQTSSVLQSIYGNNNIQQAQYTQQMLKQEQRTNTILWIVIGLVLALGVFLLIRKTK